jgi:hypothetical protein
MGIFSIHKARTLGTRFVQSYTDVTHAYYDWYYTEFKVYVADNLISILSLPDDRDYVKHQIMEFRRRIPLHNHDVDDITTIDIIRFCSYQIYKWLFCEFYNKLYPYFGYVQSHELIRMVEMGILVPIDCICLHDDMVSTDVSYNQYITNLSNSVSDRFMSDMKKKIHLKTMFVAAVHIQRCWRKAISTPSYLICRKRLFHEFYEMSL